MKRFVLLTSVAVLFSLGTLSAQQDQIAEGSVLEIVKPEGEFQHLKVPRKNFIIKQGGIANLHGLDGNLVVVEQVQQLGEQHKVVIRRKDGRKFFRVYPTLTAHWPEAFQAGELRQVR